MGHIINFTINTFLIVFFIFSSITNANSMVGLSSVRDSLGYIDTPFKKGETQTTVEFEIDRGQSFWPTIVIPIIDARFELIAPDGTVVMDSQNSKIKVTHGSDIRPGLPGASYELPLVDVANKPGTWQFIVQYDAPDYDSMIVTQIFRQMTVSAKVSILGHLAVVGDLMAPSVLVTADAKAIPDAEVSFLITYPDGATVTTVGYDNGSGFDALAGDGVYSSLSTYPYQQLGEHIIEASVIAQHLGYEYRTQAGKNIVVTEQRANVNKAELFIPTDVCVDKVILKSNVTIKKSGTYSVYSSLSGTLDNRFGVRAIKSMNLSEGDHDIELIFTKKMLVNRFSRKDVISFSPLLIETTDYTKSGTREFNSVVNPRVAIPDTFSLDDINFCRDDIEVTKKITTTENMSVDESYIESLELSFPVYVNQAGSYTSSLSIISKAHETLATINFNSSLSAGDNQVKFTVDGSKLKKVDGPYLVRSLMIYGNSKNKMVSQLGETIAYKKEQFIPKIKLISQGTLIGLKRENWDGTKNGRPVIGGYARTNASVPYDYESLVKFDLANVEGIVQKAEMKITLGKSSLSLPFTDVAIHVVDKAWSAETVNYNYFCDSFNVCKGWNHPLNTFRSNSGELTQVISGEKLLHLIQGWVDNKQSNHGLVLTANPAERSKQLEILNVELNVLVLK
ncbi:MAG: DNRLRE domain-containing protein [Vibrio hibernica]